MSLTASVFSESKNLSLLAQQEAAKALKLQNALMFARQSDAHAQSSNRVFNELHSDGLRCSGRRWNSFSLDAPRVEAALQERWKEEGVIGVKCDSTDCRLISFFFKKED